MDYDNLNFEDTTLTFEEAETNHLFYDSLVPTLRTRALLVRKKIIEFVMHYIDRNSESLFIIGPYKRLIFVEKQHADPLFTLLEIEKKYITSIIRKYPKIMSNFHTLNNPFFFLMTALIIIYGEDVGDRLSEEARNSCIIFMALRFYSSRIGHQFKFEPNKDIMEYTINNLSNKFVLKNEGSVYKLLVKLSNDNYNTVGVNLLKTHDDYYFVYYIMNISTKINNNLKSIYVEYMKNHANKNYLAQTDDKHDDEKSTIRDLSNLSSSIETIANKVYMSLKQNGLDYELFDNAVSITRLRASNIRSVLDRIIEDETSLLKEQIIIILQIFLMDSNHRVNMIHSRYFHTWALSIYKVSNTNSVLIMRHKEILDGWLKKYSEAYVLTNREGTKLSFRKSIFIYIVDSIIKYS
jgi:hypothetical protein